MTPGPWVQRCSLWTPRRETSVRVVVALGGNAIGDPGGSGGQRIKRAAVQLAELVIEGHELVITHGNGPQVGELMLDQDARGADRAPPLPLDILVAMTQAELGYILQREVEDELVSRDDHTDVVTVVTEVVVDEDDPQFADPSKPVGPWLVAPPDATAYIEQEGRYRRMVASPHPRQLVERAALRAIVEDGIVPICAGGGGVPVVRDGSRLRGVEAVIDKDLTSALVAADLDADALVILTDVAHVERDHGTADARALPYLSLEEARELLPTLPAGSMRPKLAAALQAAEDGRVAMIAALGEAREALAGEAGTTVGRRP